MNFYNVLRMGHRPERDKRVTTHVALTSRAFCAKKMYLHRSDSRVIETINNVVSKFGGNFTVETTKNNKKIVFVFGIVCKNSMFTNCFKIP